MNYSPEEREMIAQRKNLTYPIGSSGLNYFLIATYVCVLLYLLYKINFLSQIDTGRSRLLQVVVI